MEWIVPPEESGSKLISFLSNRLKDHYSARALKAMLEHHQCQLNGRIERFASTIVGKGDHIQLILDHPVVKPTFKVEPERILYEDESILAYNKPSGMSSDEQGILKVVRSYCPSLLLVHRLDKETTGVLLFAKNKAVFQALVEEFKQFRVKKCYAALVDGILDKNRGTIQNYLGKKHHYDGQTIWGAVTSHGLFAHTDWECFKRGKKASFVLCYPKTGRTHQLRVHLAEIGHPILGDFQYGKHFICPFRPSRYLLHAYSIDFFLPNTNTPLHIQAPLPSDFVQAQKELHLT